MNYRMIFYLLGHILRLEGLFMMPAYAISLYCGEAAAAKSLLFTIVLLFLLGMSGMLLHPQKKVFHAREGLVIVALVWMTVSALGALPFYLSGSIPHYLDALFETVSGFTTTGASILTNVEAMPMGLLYWRSFTHWLGGMGVLVFVLAIVPLAQGSGYAVHLLRAESPGPQVDKLVPQIGKSAKILYGIYIAMTLLQIFLLLLGDMPLFDSICTAFGTAGTGGFGIKNDSLAGYSPYLQSVTTIFMALFGINFNIFYFLLIRDFSKAVFDEELHVYLGVMVGAIFLITLNILPFYSGNAGSALHHAAFQVSSIMTTTGFTTANFDLWPQFSRALLLILMIFGASAGSTGGGMKAARMLILYKAARRHIRRMLSPRSVEVVRLNGKVLTDDTLQGVYSYMTVYSILALLSWLLISVDNFSLETNLSAMLSCLNNIGPGLGAVGPSSNFSAYSNFSKLVLTADMLIGRLEIFPLLAFFCPSVWRHSLGHTCATRV